MPLKGVPSQRDKDFTGFVVTYADGTRIFEKENYVSKKLNRSCATNWAEIDKSKIAYLQLYWKGELKETIQKSPDDTHSKELTAKDWFFSHRGYLDMGTRKVIIISRNIGYIEEGIIKITSIFEKNGEKSLSVRAAPK